MGRSNSGTDALWLPSMSVGFGQGLSCRIKTIAGDKYKLTGSHDPRRGEDLVWFQEPRVDERHERFFKRRVFVRLCARGSRPFEPALGRNRYGGTPAERRAAVVRSAPAANSDEAYRRRSRRSIRTRSRSRRRHGDAHARTCRGRPAPNCATSRAEREATSLCRLAAADSPRPATCSRDTRFVKDSVDLAASRVAASTARSA